MKSIKEFKNVVLPQQQNSLIKINDYDQSFLDSKKPESQILTSYFVENDEMTNQMKEITKRTDLEFCDFIAFAIQNTYGLDAQPEHIKRKWNLRANIQLRIDAKTPLMASLKVPKPLTNGLKIPKPLTETEFKPPTDDFNEFITKELSNGILTEEKIIEALKLQNYTIEQLKPYFKCLN